MHLDDQVRHRADRKMTAMHDRKTVGMVAPLGRVPNTFHAVIDPTTESVHGRGRDRAHVRAHQLVFGLPATMTMADRLTIAVLVPIIRIASVSVRMTMIDRAASAQAVALMPTPMARRTLQPPHRATASIMRLTCREIHLAKVMRIAVHVSGMETPIVPSGMIFARQKYRKTVGLAPTRRIWIC